MGDLHQRGSKMLTPGMQRMLSVAVGLVSAVGTSLSWPWALTPLTGRAITTWRVQATTVEVFDIIADAESLPRWWPAVYLEVHELEPGVENGGGRVIDQHTKGRLPYTLRWKLRVTDVQPGSSITIQASGDFVGQGCWTVEQDGEWAVATCGWTVRANKPLVRRLSFVMKPMFSANHRWAMARGGESLRLELVRRRAATPEERSRIPAPPPPRPSSLERALIAARGAARALARGLRRPAS